MIDSTASKLGMNPAVKICDRPQRRQLLEYTLRVTQRRRSRTGFALALSPNNNAHSGDFPRYRPLPPASTP